MKHHLDDYIDAYLDGELSPRLRLQTKDHLENCDRCQEMVAVRRQLSLLLQSVPAVPVVNSADRFALEVGLQLDRYPQARQSWVQDMFGWVGNSQVQKLGWHAVPVVLFLTSVFIRTVTTLTNLVNWFPDIGQWITLERTLAEVPTVLNPPVTWAGIGQIANKLSLLDWTWLSGMIGIVIISILYLAWLTVWTVLNQAKNN